MEGVSVYIDGANFFYGLRLINRRYTDFNFDFAKYVKHIIGNRLLVDVYYYNACFKSIDDFDHHDKIYKK